MGINIEALGALAIRGKVWQIDGQLVLHEVEAQIVPVV
jgi:hypothetical protein